MKLLWIAFVWPEPDSSAAGCRTAQLIEAFRLKGHHVEVCSPCRDNGYKAALSGKGIPTASYEPNDSVFDSYVRSVRPDVVVFDRFVTEEQFGWRVREQCPEALRVLDTVDLRSLRSTRQRMCAAGRDPMVLGDSDLVADDAVREVAAILRSDLSLIISGAEIDLLRDRYRISTELLQLCRMGVAAADNLPGFESRHHFVTIGNFQHEPNVDSYRLLHRSLWKNIREQLRARGVSDAELHIYGAYPTKEFTELDNPQAGFRVMGKAKDARETLKSYRVNLAPLRFGAGIKGKVVDGWSAGTPCVGTPIAAEGMHGDLPFGGAVALEWDDFARLAAELYTDQQRWEGSQRAGTTIVRELYDGEQIATQTIDSIETALREKECRRQRNFIGSMLWHHQNRSTEFFSRWIEAKNAKRANGG